MRKDTSTSVHGLLRASEGNGVRPRNQAARLVDTRVYTYSAEGKPTALGPTNVFVYKCIKINEINARYYNVI